MTDKEDDFFGDDFEKEMRKFQRIINDMVKKMMKDLEEGTFTTRPFVYGISFKIGPDGLPRIEDFGTVPQAEKVSEGVREPFTDVMEDERNIYITMELPGVEKEDINMELVDSSLIVTVDTGIRKYYKEIPLPDYADPENIEAKYNNGVLDITIKKKEEKKAKKKIKVK